jgi:hypothetical protein
VNHDITVCHTVPPVCGIFFVIGTVVHFRPTLVANFIWDGVFYSAVIVLRTTPLAMITVLLRPNVH